MPYPAAIVVMGVSGAGKTTLGQALAERLDYSFIEADAFHPPENVRKMRNGIALEDADRWPWLDAVAKALARASRSGGGVAACSALKRAYRDFIRDRLDVPLHLVHPALDSDLARRRMERRQDHYMPASLLASQMRTLEQPGADENVIVVDADLSIKGQVEFVDARLSRNSPPPP